MESVWKPSNVEISPNCPRCGSSNTKFCYYNNYSLTQPRYFCKGCRRYWTKGGSLRNVPVGGGCRKNRRGNNNKSLRQSFEGLTFKNSPCSDSNNSIGCSSYDPRRTCSPSSSSIVTTNEGPNIDLALVYANFLNQKQDSREEPKKTEQMQTIFDPSLENSSTLPEELGLVACLNPSKESHFSCEGSNHMYLSEFNTLQTTNEKDRIEQCSNHDAINFELPPLPDEDELASHDLMWSNSHDMMVNHAFQATSTHTPLFGPSADHDADLLIGNWSPFDLPREDASFSSP